VSTEHEHPSGEDDPLVAPREDAELPAEREPAGSVVEQPDGAEAPPPLYEERPPEPERPPEREPSRNMLPGRERRRSKLERLIVRLVATCGVVGIGVAIAAIMVSSKSQGWVVGLVVSIVTVILSALLWSSRML
jgi:hypothetical protein